MIEILDKLLRLPFAVALSALLLLALLYSIRDKLRRRREKQYIYRCKNCGYIYLFERNMPMQSCPRCGQLNDVFRN